MRKSGTHSARVLRKRPAGKRGKRKKNTRIPLVAFCALAVGALAAGYGFTHQHAPEMKAIAATPPVAPSPEPTGIARAPSDEVPVSEQALRKEDRLITGSIPAQPEIAAPVILPKPKPEAAKKKKPAVAKVQEPVFFVDDIKPEAQQRR